MADLDYSVLASNHPGDNYTTAIYPDENSVGLQEHTINGLNMIGHYINEQYGAQTIITGGAERWIHSGGEYSHHTGDKADIVISGITPQNEAGQDLMRFCRANGWSINYENEGTDNAHWDIDFTGHDSRDYHATDDGEGEETSGGFTGGFLSATNAPFDNATNRRMHGNENPVQVDLEGTEEKLEDWGYLEGLVKTFWNSATTTGFSDLAQTLWGHTMHTGKWWWEQKDERTEDDVAYVKKYLGNDEKDIQTNILLTARDREELEWLVNQRIVEQNREQQIQNWKEKNDGTLSSIASFTAGLTGAFLDPTILLPIGEAAAGVKILSRFGTAIRDVAKAREVAAITARTTYDLAKAHAPLAGQSVLNDYLKQTFGGRKVDYLGDAAVTVIGGAVLGALGHGAVKLWKNGKLGNKPYTENVIKEADRIETQGLMGTAGLDRELIRNETIGRMKTLHDSNFGKTIKSAVYDKLEGNGRIVATTYDKAKDLMYKLSGRELPETAKAFYIPNEDYMVLLTDRIKDPVNETERLLAHEMGVHASLMQSLGKEEYANLMNEVTRLADIDGHSFNQIRRAHDTYDPEEIFAHAVEEGALPNKITTTIQKGMNRVFGTEGYTHKITNDDVLLMLKQQAENTRGLGLEGFHFNDDGTTVFGGVRFSTGNLANPQLWADYIKIDPELRNISQGDLPVLLRRVTQKMEQGYVGTMIDSKSNTARKFANLLFQDTRGRGQGNQLSISAEDIKDRLVRQLNVPYLEMASVRREWMGKNGAHIPNRAKQLCFDELVTLRYNEKYAGHTGSPLGEMPEEVETAVDAIYKYRQKQVELGKRSSSDVGSKNDDLVDHDWYPTDDELWRLVALDKRQAFLGKFNKTSEAEEALTEYVRMAADRDKIKESLLRDIVMKNKKIERKNEDLRAKGIQEIPKEPEFVSDAQVEEWLEKAIPNGVHTMLYGSMDQLSKNAIAEVGKLNFLGQRIPMDTSKILVMNKGKGNEFQFSFDNNLRDFDLDKIIQRNTRRFAGEAALKAVFNSTEDLNRFLENVQKELKIAVESGAANKSTLNTYQDIEQGIYELRGMRPQEEQLGKAGILARMGMMLSYVKNGVNMGISQLGELAGTMGYGGWHQLFAILPSTARLMGDIKYGKVGNQILSDADAFLFGESLEAHIWDINYADTVTRDALTEKGSLINRALITAGDKLNMLSKATSTLNMLPKMTDTMYREMRKTTMMDAIHWANGKEFSRFRNPFSKAKLKGAHVSDQEAEAIKEALRKYTKLDNKGEPSEFNYEAWMNEDPVSFTKFYGLIQTQAERAIVNGARIGSKNLTKESNFFTRIMFQFQDYTLRAINGQTLRGLTARDADDAIAATLSIITNTAAYALRCGLYYGMLKAAGLTDKAEEYYDRMFNKGRFASAAATRSSFIGPIPSLANNVYEAVSGSPSVRSTVNINRGIYGKQQERDFSDKAGDFFAQIPAVKVVTDYPTVLGNDIYKLANGEQWTKRDLHNTINLIPFAQNFIPLSVFITKFINESNLPDKEPKKKQ